MNHAWKTNKFTPISCKFLKKCALFQYGEMFEQYLYERKYLVLVQARSLKYMTKNVFFLKIFII